MAFDYHIIRNARDAINYLDEKRREKGISQMKLTEIADFPDVGQTYARFYGSGDGKVSKCLKIANAIEFTIVAVPNESMALFVALMDEIKDALNEKGETDGKEQGNQV